MKSNRQLKIGVIGLWQLGCTYAASLAKMGYLVEGYDLDKKIIENLKLGKAPIFEPGLDKVISEHLNKNLTFSYNLDNFLIIRIIFF